MCNTAHMNAPHIRVGMLGEVAVANHLKRKGYVLRERNYRKKWGEIDIVMEKEGVVHFIEVKTVSHDTTLTPNSMGTWQPEENVDHRKLRKLFRTIETWCLERAYAGEWQLDVAAVHLDSAHKRARVKIIENIV